MTTLDRDRLAKFLGMLGSAHDGEVLNAARKADKMVRDAGLTWERVLLQAGRLATAGAPVRADHRTPPSKRGTQRYGRPASQRRATGESRVDTEDIEQMLSVVSERRHDMGTLMMLAGFRDEWERRGSLSQEQYHSLKRLHEGPRGGGAWRW